MGLDALACAQVWLVAADEAGNAQDSPTLISLQTAPDTSPPALLAGSGPGAVSSLPRASSMQHPCATWQAAALA